MSTTNYTGCKVQLSTQLDNYGDGLDAAGVAAINRTLGKMIEDQFPGVEVVEGLESKVTSWGMDADYDACEEARQDIDNWINDNWTKAL